MKDSTAIELLKIARDLTVSANDKSGLLRSSVRADAGRVQPDIEKAFEACAEVVIKQFHQLIRAQ